MVIVRASVSGWGAIAAAGVVFACASNEKAGDDDADESGGRAGAMAGRANRGGSAGRASGGVGGDAGTSSGESGSGGSDVPEGGTAGVSAGMSGSGAAGIVGGTGAGGTLGGAGGALGGGGGASGSGSGGAAGAPACREATFETKTYLLCPHAGLDQASARAFCQSRGADLIKLDSEAEDLWAYETVIEPGSIWIGANDIEQEGVWRWPDGTLVPGGYVAWVTGQPNDSNGGEDCAVLHSGMGRWNDVACTETGFAPDPMSFICEP